MCWFGTKGISLQIGADSGQTLTLSLTGIFEGGKSTGVELSGVTAKDLSVGTTTGQDAKALTLTSAGTITSIQTAIDSISALRSKLGAYQNRLTHAENNLSTESENLSSAQSTITDVDMAKEMTTYTKNNILVQSAEAMLAQANQLPQGVLSLLK